MHTYQSIVYTHSATVHDTDTTDLYIIIIIIKYKIQ